jgi:hypothetical protein
MSRTQGRVDGDTEYKDGLIWIPILPTYVTTGTGQVINRPAAGRVATSLPTTATAYVLMIPLGNLLFRAGVQDDLQEQFGSANAGGAQGLPVPGFTTYTTGSLTKGNNVSIPVISSDNLTVGHFLTLDTVASGVQEFPMITSVPDATHVVVNQILNSHSTNAPLSDNVFTTPAGVTGRPPFTGITELTPVTAPRPKGIKFKAMYPVYTIGGAAATTNTIGLTQTTFANNGAPATTNIVAVAANGLSTATQANPYLTPISVPSAAAIFRTIKFSDFVLEWDFTTGSGGTGLLEGVFLDVSYNYT